MIALSFPTRVPSQDWESLRAPIGRTPEEHIFEFGNRQIHSILFV